MVASLVIAVSMACAGAPVRVESLLEEMVSLESWSRLPDPFYRLIVRSNGDQRSAEGSGEARGMGLPSVLQVDGRTEYVLFDEAGPGIISRVAIRSPVRGVLRVYLDQAAKPVIEGSLEEIAAGRIAPWEKPFSRVGGEGIDVEYPMPFAVRGRVSFEIEDPASVESLRYQVTGRQYEAGALVETFSAAGGYQATDAHRRAASILSGEESPDRQKGWDLRFPLVLSANHPSAEIQLPQGTGGVIGELRLKASTTNLESLRESILAISFDGRPTVRVPLVELFGSMAGGGGYRSLASEVTHEGELILRAPMPFVERAEIVLEGPGSSMAISSGREKRGALRRILKPRDNKNKSQRVVEPLVAPPAEVSVEGYAQVGPYQWNDRSVYFHAQWGPIIGSGSREKRNQQTLLLSGRGTYVGSSLFLSSPVRQPWEQVFEQVAVDAAEGGVWRGELDESFGATRQSLKLMEAGLRGLSRCDGPGFFGHSAQVSWRTLDAVSFTNSLRFDWQTSGLVPGVAAWGVHYWYADAWSAAPRPRLTLAEVAIPELPVRMVPKVAGAIEGESLVVIDAHGSKPAVENRIQDEQQGPWSEDAQLVWHGLAPGAELTLGFDAPRPGKYRVAAFFSKGVDYGIHQVMVNEQSAGDPIDFFDPQPMRMPTTDLGEFELRSTGNRLKVRVVSTSKSASPKSCTFGLDALVLTPVRPTSGADLSSAIPTRP
jgi:hypothetical protein